MTDMNVLRAPSQNISHTGRLSHKSERVLAFLIRGAVLPPQKLRKEKAPKKHSNVFRITKKVTDITAGKCESV